MVCHFLIKSTPKPLLSDCLSWRNLSDFIHLLLSILSAIYPSIYLWMVEQMCGQRSPGVTVYHGQIYYLFFVFFSSVYFVCYLSIYLFVGGWRNARSKVPRSDCLSWGNLLFLPALKFRLPPVCFIYKQTPVF